jgi:hypothetical protein
VAAVAFAGLVLASVLGPASLIHLGDKNDQRMSKVLASPGAVERFHDEHGDQNTAGQDTTPPLVRQAERFKDIIDPKVQPEVAKAPRAEHPVRSTSATKAPPAASAKFTLIGTSCSFSNPDSSFAYVRFPDNTYRWIQSGSEIGHLIVKEVREDSIVCWDGQRDTEVAMEVVPDRVSMLLDTEESAVSSAETPAAQPVEVKVTETPVNRPRFTTRPIAPPAMHSGASKLADNEREAMDDIVNRLKRLQNVPGGGDASLASEADRLAAANKLISELRSSRVSPQETRNLENMGDQITQGSERIKE